MKPSQFIAFGLAGLALAGCRTDPQIELLERELRLQEDQIYRLRECIEDYQAALDVQRGTAFPERSATGDTAAGLPLDISGVPEPSAADAVPRPSGDSSSEADPGIAPPSTYPLPEKNVEPGPSQDPSEVVPSDAVEPSEAAPHDVPEGQQTSAAGPIVPADSRQVARLVLNRLRTGGYDADGRLGDEGITAVIEPRDAQGRAVTAPADVSAVAVDPALQGEAARVARWDFTVAETAGLFRTWRQGRGIQLNMPWPAGPPVHGELHLFVRYATSDGRQLQADGPIKINLPGKQSAGWMTAKQPAPKQQPNRPADSRQLARSPEIQLPTSPSPRTAVRPAEPVSHTATPKLQRPVWSPHRQ